MKKLGIVVGVLVAGLCLASTAQAISQGPGGRVYYGGLVTVGDTTYNRLLQLVEAGNAEFIFGPKPTLEQIEGMPGSFLLQPGLRTSTLMPRYEDGWDEYVDNLRRSGG